MRNSHLLLSPTSGIVVTLKIGRREVPGSNPDHSCLVFEVFRGFSETRANTGSEGTEGTHPTGAGPISGQLAFNLQPTLGPQHKSKEESTSHAPSEVISA